LGDVGNQSILPGQFFSSFQIKPIGSRAKSWVWMGVIPGVDVFEVQASTGFNRLRTASGFVDQELPVFA
jgi:hypothetical protein